MTCSCVAVCKKIHWIQVMLCFIVLRRSRASLTDDKEQSTDVYFVLVQDGRIMGISLS